MTTGGGLEAREEEDGEEDDEGVVPIPIA